MANTTFEDVYDVFEATFADKVEISASLKKQWLKMSVARWNTEIAVNTLLIIDEELLEFNGKLPQPILNVLGAIMKEYYQLREFSRSNKISSIVGRDLSINGSMVMSKYSKEDLDNTKEMVSEMISKITPIVSD